MPSSSKSPQAPSTKSHSFLRKSTDESPSKTTSTSVPSEVRTSQSTNSLNPRYNESNHPEEDDVISDDEKTPEEIASAELRANRRRRYDPNSSLDENNTSFLSGVGPSVSSRLADPRPFHGDVHVYEYVFCTSTRYREHLLISSSTRLTPC